MKGSRGKLWNLSKYPWYVLSMWDPSFKSFVILVIEQVKYLLSQFIRNKRFRDIFVFLKRKEIKESYLITQDFEILYRNIWNESIHWLKYSSTSLSDKEIIKYKIRYIQGKVELQTQSWLTSLVILFNRALTITVLRYLWRTLDLRVFVAKCLALGSRAF